MNDRTELMARREILNHGRDLVIAAAGAAAAAGNVSQLDALMVAADWYARELAAVALRIHTAD